PAPHRPGAGPARGTHDSTGWPRPGRRQSPVAEPPDPPDARAGDGQRTRPAATAAPSSQQASRSAADTSPMIVTGACAAFQPSPVVTFSTERTAPVVSLFPWT